VSDQTEAHLVSLDPAIFRQAYTMIVAARDAGIPLVIISGRRSSGVNVEVGGAPRSYHLDGLAFDVAVYGYATHQIPLDWWAQLGRWAEGSLGLYWGGRFEHHGRPDVNHFDARRYLIPT
jgi:uncharacterized protein YcbK (DUF882 family)